MTGLHDRLTDLGFSNPQLLGQGLEFTVFRAEPRDGGAPVAIRVGERRFDSNANDPWVDTRALLRQEYRLAQLLRDHGLPVADPVDLILADTPDEPDILVSDYIEDDGSTLDCFHLGGVLARLHTVAPTSPHLTATERQPPPDLVVNRVLRRWNEIGRLLDDWPRPPTPAKLLPIAAPLDRPSLLHLDVRRANIRCHDGKTVALLDWSNALRADPVLEFGRLTEFARLPDNQLDLPALRAGYASHAELPPHTGPIALLCQLDAAVMLALVFLSESPDPARADAAVSRVLELREQLAQ